MPYLRDYQKYCGNITCREACYKEIKKILENDAFHPKAISSYDYYQYDHPFVRRRGTYSCKAKDFKRFKDWKCPRYQGTVVGIVIY